MISGSKDSITQARPYFVEAGAKLYLPLTVTGAFHSPLMQSARTEFADFLKKFNFSPLNIPVIANLNASPYQNEDIYSTLSLQIDHPVQWLQSIRYLLLRGESDFKEIGTGKVLTNLVTRIVDGQ